MSAIRFACVTAMMALMLSTPAASQGPGHCPPGLAKKSPACIPPGQAKKARDYDRWEDARERRAEALERERERREEARERELDRLEDLLERDPWLLERERRRLERERELLRAERRRLEEERRRAEFDRLFGDGTTVWSSPRPRARAPLPDGWLRPRGEQWVQIGDSFVRIDEQGRPVIRLPSVPDLLGQIGN